MTLASSDTRGFSILVDLDGLLRSMDDYIRTFDIEEDAGSAVLRISYTPLPYDAIDADLDMDEASHADFMKRFDASLRRYLMEAMLSGVPWDSICLERRRDTSTSNSSLREGTTPPPPESTLEERVSMAVEDKKRVRVDTRRWISSLKNVV
jgi:hypothetical protein